LDSSVVIQCIVLLVLILLSAFFSSAETALTTVNRVKINTLSEDGLKSANILEKILHQNSKMLSTILIGNNIVNISASSLATTLAIKLWGSVAIGIATGILTIVVLIFGEIIPKTLANLYNEKIALTYAPIVYTLIIAFTPLIIIVDFLSIGFMRIFSIDPKKKLSSMTEKELKSYVDVSHEDGVIETEEREMILNVFDFSDAVARDIMIPRIDMTTIDIDSTYQELFDTFKASMYTRIPVYKDDPDNIIGMVNIKDLLMLPKKDFHIQKVLRDVHYTYELKKTPDLLLEMREKRMNLAIVINEYAACVGMITLEDLLEEIVGEIRDEYDADEEDYIVEAGERAFLVEGGMKLSDINDALHTSFESENYDSIGGIIIEILDRLPNTGESVTTSNGTVLTVTKLEKNRIKKVHMLLPEEHDAAGEVSQEERNITKEEQEK